MHIVHLYDGHEKVYNGRGSVPKVVWKAASGVAALDHDVTVVERQWRGLDATETQEGVQFDRISLPTGTVEPWERVPYELAGSPLGMARLVGDRTTFAAVALRKLWSMDFDVLHVHLPFAANVLLTVAPWLRKKTVYTAHLGELRMNALADEQRSAGDVESSEPGVRTAVDGGTQIAPTVEELDSPGMLKYFSPDMFLARRAAHTTVLNPRIASVFHDRGVPEDRLSVIPNGVDVQQFADVSEARIDAVRESYGVGDGPVLLFVGTVMPRKGVDDLVRAAGHLVREHDLGDLEVVIAGEDELDGEYTERVRELAHGEGVADRVTFTGFVPEEDLPALYALADAFVLPSREEGFGMTVAEAMAAGTPVVATTVGGIPTLVDEGEQGYLVKPNDHVELAGQIERLLSHSEAELVQMGVNARARAQEYSWSGIARQFASVYERVTR